MTPQPTESIGRLARHHFGDEAEIWLFGSRVDDSKKGGDYDFLMEVSFDAADAIVEHKTASIADLQSSTPFEDEKIAGIVKRQGTVFELPKLCHSQRSR